MAKVNFSKVEDMLNEGLQKLSKEELADQSVIANLIRESPLTQSSPQIIEKVFQRFQSKLEKFKKQNPELYDKLGLTPDDEKKFGETYDQLNRKDWRKISIFKEKMDDLKNKFKGSATAASESPSEEDLEHIEQTRIKQQDARFNVNSKWLPIQ